MDASDVPSEYILAILGQCTTFPRVLVFFLKGRLVANYLFQKQHLATIDTYFMISCEDGSTVPPAPPDMMISGHSFSPSSTSLRGNGLP